MAMTHRRLILDILPLWPGDTSGYVNGIHLDPPYSSTVVQAHEFQVGMMNLV